MYDHVYPNIIILLTQCSRSQLLAGYGKFRGQILTDRELGDLHEGLKENNITRYTHLLTGKRLELETRGKNPCSERSDRGRQLYSV